MSVGTATLLKATHSMPTPTALAKSLPLPSQSLGNSLLDRMVQFERDQANRSVADRKRAAQRFGRRYHRGIRMQGESAARSVYQFIKTAELMNRGGPNKTNSMMINNLERALARLEYVRGYAARQKVNMKVPKLQLVETRGPNGQRQYQVKLTSKQGNKTLSINKWTYQFLMKSGFARRASNGTQQKSWNFTSKSATNHFFRGLGAATYVMQNSMNADMIYSPLSIR